MQGHRMPRPLTADLVVAIAVLCLATACSKDEIVHLRLSEETSRAEILVESNRVVRSNSENRNRWLHGWRFVRDGGKAAARPTADPAVLEMVSVDPRERTLVLRLARTGSDLGEVTVGMEGQNIASFSVIDGRKIILPTPTWRGVVPVTLSFSDPDVISVRAVHLNAPRRAGEVVFSEGGISQQGWSLVRWTLPVAAGSRLVGSILPPKSPRPGQAFAVELKTQDHAAKEIFRWSASHAGATDFEITIAEKSGIVRVQLVALGKGDPAVWQLTVANRQPSADQRTTPHPPKTPKAVVVYVMDALRADSLGCYGSPDVNTPCFDSFAREGARFVKHFSVAPSTVPSTRSLFTGLPLQPPVGLLEEGLLTLAESFRDAGFKTGCFSSNPALSRAFGLVRGFDQVGFEELDEDFKLGVRSVNDSAARVHRASLEWLQSLHQGDQVFLYVHTLNPHNPYTPPPEYLAQNIELEDDLPVGTTRELVEIRDQRLVVTEEIRKRIRGAYAASVEYNDALLCSFVHALEKRFGREEVLLVLTSDHGEELFDHGGVLHGYTLYDEMVHIPLVIRWPGVTNPRRIERQTGTLDVHATLSTIIDNSRKSSLTSGESLWRLLLGSQTDFEERLAFAAAPGVRGTIAMVRSPRMKVVEAQSPGLQSGMGFRLGRGHDGEYVFDLLEDPEELRNQIPDDDLEAEWLKTELRAWRQRWTSAAPPGPQQQLDEATRRKLEALGYVNP